MHRLRDEEADDGESMHLRKCDLEQVGMLGVS